jgi:hypothetical protein
MDDHSFKDLNTSLAMTLTVNVPMVFLDPRNRDTLVCGSALWTSSTASTRSRPDLYMASRSTVATPTSSHLPSSPSASSGSETRLKAIQII